MHEPAAAAAASSKAAAMQNQHAHMQLEHQQLLEQLFTFVYQLMGCVYVPLGMSHDVDSSEADEEAPAGPSDHAMEDDSIQDFEGHGG